MKGRRRVRQKKRKAEFESQKRERGNTEGGQEAENFSERQRERKTEIQEDQKA